MSTEVTVSVLCPAVTAAAASPNPVPINTRLVLSLSVTEISVILKPETRYSGEGYCGEE